ncbi:MAG TPA: transposase [Firmicutes bacterium]|nr:transposase [Bacillota bacterium]
MPTRWSRNTTGLQKHAAYRAAEARRRVEEAIKQLLLAGTPVTFNAVSRQAAVSKTYLHRHAGIRNRILALREKTIRLRPSTDSEPTDAGKNVVLLAKDSRIAQLERETKYLKQLLARVYGEKSDQLASML